MQPRLVERTSRSRKDSAHAGVVPKLSTYSVSVAFYPYFLSSLVLCESIARISIVREGVFWCVHRANQATGLFHSLAAALSHFKQVQHHPPPASSGSSRSAATARGSGTTDAFVLSYPPTLEISS